MGFKLHNLDAVDYLGKFPNDSVDLMITDYAYESLEKHRKIGTTTRLKKDWFEIFPNSRVPELMGEIFRVMKKNSHLYMMTDQETMFFLKPIGESVGFKFWKPIVWDKVNFGTGYHWRAQSEYILFFEKGKRKLNSNSMSDIFTQKKIYNKYPTEKPVEIFDKLIINSSNPGEIVCDPFMGSCPVGESALRNGRKFCGNDKLKKAVEISQNRLGRTRHKIFNNEEV